MRWSNGAVSSALAFKKFNIVYSSSTFYLPHDYSPFLILFFSFEQTVL